MINPIVKFSPKAILFDWDNTLVNNWDPIIISYNETLKSLGLKKLSKEETLKNAKYSLRETFPNLFKDDWKKAREIFYKTFTKIIFICNYNYFIPKGVSIIRFFE